MWLPSLIPLGPDAESVRRVPVATFAIIGACVLVLVLCQLGAITTATETAAMDAAVQRILDFWDQHPSVNAPGWAWRVVRALPNEQRARFGVSTGGTEVETQAADAPAQEKFEQLWVDLWNAIPEDPALAWSYDRDNPSVIGAITHMFAHTGWAHVFWNMLFLFVCAVLLEDVWGRGVFLGFYVLSGLAALVPDILFFSDRGGTTLGASGAVSAVMGAFAVRFWKVRVRLLLLVGIIARPIWVSSWLIVLFWFAWDVAWIPYQLAGGHIDHVAHVVGFAFGALFALAMRSWKVEERWLAAAVEARSSTVLVDNPHIEWSISDLSRGRDRVAQRRLTDALERRPDDVDTALTLWNLSLDRGEPRDGAAAITRAIGIELRKGDLANAVDHWRELLGHVPEATMDATSLTHIAKEIADRGLREEAIATLQRALHTPSNRVTCASLLSMAALLAELDDPLATTAADAVLARADATPYERGRAESLRLRRAGESPDAALIR